MRGSTEARIRAHVAHLGSEDDVLWGRSCRWLWYYGSRAFEPLVEACAVGSQGSRCRAAMLLGRTRDPRAFEVLVPLLEDSDGGVRYDAGVALGISGDPRAVPILMAAMLTESEDDLVQSGSQGAGHGLTEMGEMAVPALLAALPRASVRNRTTLGFVLAGTGVASVMPVLEGFLSDPDASVREAAEDMIENLEHRISEANSKPRL